MPNTTNPKHQKLSDAIECEQQLFLMDFDIRSTNLSKATAIILNLIEVNEAYRCPLHRSYGDASKLSLGIDDEAILKTFLLDTIRLSSEYALQELEWLYEHHCTLRKARKADVEDAAQACSK